MLHRWNLFVCSAALLAVTHHVHAKFIEVPVLETNWWWQIAENHPDVSPWDTHTANACDFTIFRASNGMWQLIACIRGTTYPGSNRLFYRWESSHLTNVMWTSRGIFATSNTNAPLYQWPGVMQAPHCFTNNGRYYFFYNGPTPTNPARGRAMQRTARSVRTASRSPITPMLSVNTSSS